MPPPPPPFPPEITVPMRLPLRKSTTNENKDNATPPVTCVDEINDFLKRGGTLRKTKPKQREANQVNSAEPLVTKSILRPTNKTNEANKVEKFATFNTVMVGANQINLNKISNRETAPNDAGDESHKHVYGFCTLRRTPTHMSAMKCKQAGEKREGIQLTKADRNSTDSEDLKVLREYISATNAYNSEIHKKSLVTSSAVGIELNKPLCAHDPRQYGRCPVVTQTYETISVTKYTETIQVVQTTSTASVSSALHVDVQGFDKSQLKGVSPNLNQRHIKNMAYNAWLDSYGRKQT